MGNLVKTFLGTFLIIMLITNFFVPFSPDILLAQEEATPSPKTTFEAFWPLTAGRTVDDPLYSLKIFKENLRGIFIFGSPQKAEYAVLLGTKRVLEADKLFSSGKKDLADKTFGMALEQFDKAKSYIDDAKKNKRPFGSSEFTIKPRLENLINLVPTIKSEMSGEVLQKIKDLKISF